MVDEIEKWRLEWDNYFDDLENALHRLDDLAVKADKEGFEEVTCKLIEAGTALIRHARLCEDFLNRQTIVMAQEMYKQNPLLKLLLENGKDTLLKTGAQIGEPDAHR